MTICPVMASVLPGNLNAGRMAAATALQQETPTEKHPMRSLAANIVAGLALAVTSGAAHAQISDDVVKIGVLTDMSSLYADATGKGSLAAVQMAVADFGAKVKGKPVEVVAADHENKPDVGISIARNWYDNEKVDAIFDVPTSSVALPISALTREKNKIN